MPICITCGAPALKRGKTRPALCAAHLIERNGHCLLHTDRPANRKGTGECNSCYGRRFREENAISSAENRRLQYIELMRVMQFYITEIRRLRVPIRRYLNSTNPHPDWDAWYGWKLIDFIVGDDEGGQPRFSKDHQNFMMNQINDNLPPDEVIPFFKRWRPHAQSEATNHPAGAQSRHYQEAAVAPA